MEGLSRWLASLRLPRLVGALLIMLCCSWPRHRDGI